MPSGMSSGGGCLCGTYTDALPERIPLEQNKEFKTIRNAVIQEAIKLCRQPEAELNGDLICRRSISPTEKRRKDFRPGKPTAMQAMFRLTAICIHQDPPPWYLFAFFQQLGQLLQTRIQQERHMEQGHVDRKLKRQLDEKKQAQGIRD